MAQEGNDEQDDGKKFQQGNYDKSSGPGENALERMKTHKSVLLVGIEQQKDECGDKGKVGERTGDAFAEPADFTLRSRRSSHGAAARRAEDSLVGHLSGALWA
jgi:hypothetical protein